MTTRLVLAAGCLIAFAVTTGCGSAPEGEGDAVAVREVKKATAWLNSRSESDMGGSAIFIKSAGGIDLMVSVEQAPAGTHAVHIHEFGDCSAPDAKSAGGHWNPTGENHGKWGEAPHHLGDIGNVEVGEDGTGTLSLTTDRWTMGSGGDNDIIGKSVIVHESVDDFTSQPTGAAGGRIGCGVINAN